MVLANPAAFTADLALSSHNLSTHRSNAGDYQGALEAITEAVTLYRPLARTNPATFTPTLAASLNSLSAQRSNAGDDQGALEAVTEAVTLYQPLAHNHPAGFTHNLSASTWLMADLVEHGSKVWHISIDMVPDPAATAPDLTF